MAALAFLAAACAYVEATTTQYVGVPRFQPTDFQLGTLLGEVPGAMFADWPVQYGYAVKRRAK